MPRKEVANAKRRVDVQPIRSATRKKTANSKTGYNKSAKKNIKRVLSNGGKPEIRAVGEGRTFGERQTANNFTLRRRNGGVAGNVSGAFAKCWANGPLHKLYQKERKKQLLAARKMGKREKSPRRRVEKKVKTEKTRRIGKMGRARRESR